VRAQEGTQAIRLTIGTGMEIGVIAAQQLQPPPGLVRRLQPDDLADRIATVGIGVRIVHVSGPTSLPCRPVTFVFVSREGTLG